MTIVIKKTFRLYYFKITSLDIGYLKTSFFIYLQDSANSEGEYFIVQNYLNLPTIFHIYIIFF